MAMIQNTQSYAGEGLLARLGGFVAQMQEARARRRLFRETLRELNALSSRELNDLGLNRSMLTRIAHESAYGK